MVRLRSQLYSRRPLLRPDFVEKYRCNDREADATDRRTLNTLIRGKIKCKFWLGSEATGPCDFEDTVEQIHHLSQRVPQKIF